MRSVLMPARAHSRTCALCPSSDIENIYAVRARAKLRRGAGVLMVALAVVMHAERILLIEEAKPGIRGTWNLPGGRVEPGEGLVDAVLREVQEEAGLAVQLKGLLYLDQVQTNGVTSESRLRFVFVAEPDPGSAQQYKTQADEHSLGARWFQRAELASLPLRNRYVLEMAELAARAPQLLPISSLRARSDA